MKQRDIKVVADDYWLSLKKNQAITESNRTGDFLLTGHKVDVAHSKQTALDLTEAGTQWLGP